MHRRRHGRMSTVLGWVSAAATIVVISGCSAPAADSEGSGESVAVLTDVWLGGYGEAARGLASRGYDISVTSDLFELWGEEVAAAQQRSDPNIVVILAGASIAPTPEAQQMAATEIADVIQGFESASCVLVARVPPGGSPWLGDDPTTLNQAIEEAVAGDPRVHLIDVGPVSKAAEGSPGNLIPAAPPPEFVTTLEGQLATCGGQGA